MSSSSKINTETNRQNSNITNFNPFLQGMELWQSSAMSWVLTYNEFVKNASRMTEYWFKQFWNPWNSSEPEKKDKVKVE
jgi:hypothetical protein